MEPARSPAKRCYEAAGATNVCSIPVEVPAATRARWLAEVAEALVQADGLLRRLKLSGRHAVMVAELALRIEVATREVERLRISVEPGSQSRPPWTNLPPWDNDLSA